MSSPNIRTVLEETRKVYLEIIPEFFTLNQYHEFPVATLEEIQDFEQKIGVDLPQDFKDFLLYCNFQLQITGNFNTYEFELMRDRWESWAKSLANGVFERRLTKPDSGDNSGMEQKIIKQNWWNNKWIPFAEDSGGNLFCIDLDPAEHGTFGQIIQMEMSSGPFFEGSKSITEFCAKQLNFIKNNQYTVDSGSLCIDEYL